MPEKTATVLKGNFSFIAWRARLGRGLIGVGIAVGAIAANVPDLEWGQLLEPTNFFILLVAFLAPASTSAKATKFGATS